MKYTEYVYNAFDLLDKEEATVEIPCNLVVKLKTLIGI